jgi:hypothetical protein
MGGQIDMNSLPLEQQVPTLETCIKLQPYLNNFETYWSWLEDEDEGFILDPTESAETFTGLKKYKAPTVAELFLFIPIEDYGSTLYVDTFDVLWQLGYRGTKRFDDNRKFFPTLAEALAQLYIEIMKEQKNEYSTK